jgi:hypothetical protein
MKRFLILLLLQATLSAAVQAQTNEDKKPVDSVMVRKYSLDSRNTTAQSGKYKNFKPEVIFKKEENAYYLSMKDSKGYHVYIQIKDDDDNVILFKETQIEPGNSLIKFETEEGEQKNFKVTFQELDGSKSATYIFESYDELVYIYNK